MAKPGAWTYRRAWPSDPRHVADAREFVAQRLSASGLDRHVEVVRLVVSHWKLFSSMTVDGGPGRHLDDRAILIDGRATRILREHGWVVFESQGS